MTAYQVNHAYTARKDGRTLGPWVKGDTVDVDPADAEWVERDSPGALSEVKPKPSERQKPAGPDRQHRGGANRSG
ncbi:hypothetical protein ABGB07_03870 [Micromonosporaceae bacterium B7E4]